MNRQLKREVKIGNITIGGNHPIAVQTMLNVPVKDIAGNVAQAQRVAKAGCQIVRVTVPTPEDAAVVSAIKEAVDIPVVADIHFDYRAALAALDAGADKIRINPTDARVPLCINNVEAFLAPALITEPTITRDQNDKVSIKAGDKGAEVYYTTDGSEPTKASTRYQEPFDFSQKGIVQAIAYDPTFDKSSPVATSELDIPASCYQVRAPREGNNTVIFDGNGHTTLSLPKNKPELIVELNEAKTIKGFRYTPNQGRDATGHITHYQFFVDGKKMAEGEFSNIKANPIEQIVNCTPTKGRQIRLVALSYITGRHNLPGIAEFSVITEE